MQVVLVANMHLRVLLFLLYGGKF